MTSEDSRNPRTDRGGGTRALTLVSIIILVAGLAILGVFGARYLGERSTADEIVEARESATVAASEIVQTVFSFHYEDVDASLAQLEEASTGNFLAEQRQFSDEVRERVEEQQAVVTATVSNTAVSALDIDEGTASVLVVFTAHSEREGEEDITRRQSSVVELVWEDERWKAAEVSQVGLSVPVGASSESVRALDETLGGTDGSTGDGGGGTAEAEADDGDDDGEGP